jgi:DNA mismatch repair protein MutL
MGLIRVLSDQVANKIAAGEVVERPASVVKELLENSIDAGAAELRIDVESGGRRLIRVADDGCGMLRDDAMLAFERHATSKLRDVKDLLSIATLGFRGEALPSIASVSRLVLESRSGQDATGTRVEIAGGKMLRCEEAALAVGTTVTVRDLFYNVPARKKFLRSDQTELAHIASLATHYSLAHPDKTFLLRSGATELLYVTPAAEMRERVYQVFGSQTMEDLIDLGGRERSLELPPPALPPNAPVSAHMEEPEEPRRRAFRLRGFVSRPQVQKLNRNSIYLFVNRRLIRDRLLLHAISSAYHNLMPPACYPFALLFLECDHGEVDVNVHPSKTEVRFRHSSFIHDFVRDSIRDLLIESRPASSFPMRGPAQPGVGLPYSEFTQQIENQAWPAGPSEVVPGVPEQPVGSLPEFTLKGPAPPERRFDFSGTEVRFPEPGQSPPPQAHARQRIPDTHGGFPAGALVDASPGLDALPELRPLGQIHESFIVAAGRDGLWIIDQHVAHERILFEKLLQQRASGRVEMQQLLLPLLIQLTPAQQVEYARIADELRALGFDTEPFGPRTIAVKAGPAGVRQGDIENVIFEILEIAEGELRKVSMDDLRRAMAASVACHAAIKINMRLDQSKMEWLLSALAATQCPMSCPHGRPIALRYSTRDILRGFHRI